MKFSTATNSLGNSYVLFKKKMENGKSWSAGSIQMIFHLRIEEESRMHRPFFAIKPYLPLNAADTQFNPYRKYLFAAGQLVYEEWGDIVVCLLDKVLCHFVHTPYRSKEIPKPCIHVLPLDRVCASSFFSSRSVSWLLTDVAGIVKHNVVIIDMGTCMLGVIMLCMIQDSRRE